MSGPIPAVMLVGHLRRQQHAVAHSIDEILNMVAIVWEWRLMHKSRTIFWQWTRAQSSWSNIVCKCLTSPWKQGFLHWVQMYRLIFIAIQDHKQGSSTSMKSTPKRHRSNTSSYGILYTIFKKGLYLKPLVKNGIAIEPGEVYTKSFVTWSQAWLSSSRTHTPKINILVAVIYQQIELVLTKSNVLNFLDILMFL